MNASLSYEQAMALMSPEDVAEFKAQWGKASQTKGATISLSNACAEFGFEKDQLAVLPCRHSSCYGNSFPVFLTVQVKRLAQKLQGVDGAKLRALQNSLRQVHSRIKETEKTLAKERSTAADLRAQIEALGGEAEDEPKAKQPAAGKRGRAVTAAPAKGGKGGKAAAKAPPAKARKTKKKEESSEEEEDGESDSEDDEDFSEHSD